MSFCWLVVLLVWLWQVAADPSAPLQVEISPGRGSFKGFVVVTMATCEESVIRYTVDGTSPRIYSMQYVRPLKWNTPGITVFRQQHGLVCHLLSQVPHQKLQREYSQNVRSISFRLRKIRNARKCVLKNLVCGTCFLKLETRALKG